MALLEIAEMGFLVLLGCLMASWTMLELWRLYQLRAIERLFPLNDQHSANWRAR